ncbi:MULTISPECIES: zinc ABC transporter substrate-binding protein [unclassified Guyparkeria]|uniref:metal ABC transporter solute-binding protein, Zn/Mn family n=1 Tax=unclassified Guyparkeria TaxID=2626246 RepID=UPI00073394BD|nr:MULTISPECIES: zinc ABC transporter substrate-binding protein [unclassified Guyparkeria]KTG15911.1 ABC transporter substrate-binding protein [Guyparkeria sp. XI15]OAE84661.1 ABC transporter substrate-binding protein [Guyparkeria sp. WRN-7]
MPSIARLVLLPLGIVLLAMNVARAGVPVAVSIPPQAHFVEAIGGDHVEVQIMVPANAEPITYEPTPRQMSALSRAELYFATGVPFEKGWLPRFRDANPDMTVIDTTARIQRRAMATDHDHGADADGHAAPADNALDPHVWLSPALVRLQAESIRDALIAADPEHAADYHRGFRRFAEQVHRLDQAILDALTDIDPAARRFLVFHPAFGYFAASYGLEQMAIEVEGKEPGPRELARIIEEARTHGIRVIFIEPQFAQGAARTIAREIGGEVVTLDPLARDWPAGMRAIADTLSAALGNASSREAAPVRDHEH